MYFPEQHGISEIRTAFQDELPRQPKKDIARALATLGIETPTIYPDFETAMASGEPFIARSEHPAELYHSGLGSTFKVDPAKQDDHKRGWRGPERVRSLDELLRNEDRTYSMLTDRDTLGRLGFIQAERWRAESDTEDARNNPAADDFARQHSLSYWRYIQGYNRFVVADSGRPNRYFVGTIVGSLISERTRFTGVDVIEDDRIVQSYTLGGDSKRTCAPRARDTVGFYESVRHSGLFDPSNAAIVEMVDSADGNQTFLQYLPTQEQGGADFTVRTPSTGVAFVRGSTPRDGIEFDLHTINVDKRYIKPGDVYGVTAGTTDGEATKEFYLPRAVAYVTPLIQSAEHWIKRFMWATIDHGNRSEVFKPRMSIIIDKDSYGELETAARWGNGRLKSFVQSDGEYASLQYWDPRSKKIVSV